MSVNSDSIVFNRILSLKHYKRGYIGMKILEDWSISDSTTVESLKVLLILYVRLYRVDMTLL